MEIEKNFIEKIKNKLTPYFEHNFFVSVSQNKISDITFLKIEIEFSNKEKLSFEKIYDIKYEITHNKEIKDMTLIHKKSMIYKNNFIFTFL